MSNSPQDNRNKESKENLVEYRLDKLEKGFDQLVQTCTELRNIVVRWDERFDKANFSPLTCHMHSQKIIQFTSRLDDIEKDVDGIKAFMYKCMGAFLVISIILQLIGPILVDKFRGNSNQHAIVQVEDR